MYTARFPTESIARRFSKELNGLAQNIQTDVLEAIKGLERNPRPFGQKPFKQLVPPLKLYSFAANYRVRIGDFRVLYDVDDKKKIVWVFALRGRISRG